MHEGTREVVTKAADAGEGEGEGGEEEDDAGDEPAPRETNRASLTIMSHLK